MLTKIRREFAADGTGKQNKEFVETGTYLYNRYTRFLQRGDERCRSSVIYNYSAQRESAEGGFLLQLGLYGVYCGG